MNSAGTLTYDTKLDGKGFDKGMDGLKASAVAKGQLIADGIKSVVGLVGEAGKKLIEVGKQSVEAYAQYEQLVGGLDTLFKDSSKQVQEYAKNAYKTAGIGANEYMEQVTSFSASLIQSLDGDTKRAAEYADMAITDMSDNANKMGSSMESLQVAYQGFAKGQFMLLDNLKLGYGGTKTEMERLIADANKLKKANGETANLTIDSYADIVEAIHTVQEEMEITGTTAEEANTTIEGSLNQVKASWDNLVLGLSGDTEALPDLINTLIENVGILLGNLIPVVIQVIENMAVVLQEQLPIMIDRISAFLNTMLPRVLEFGMRLIGQLVKGLVDNLPMLLQTGIDLILQLVNGLAAAMPEIIKMAFSIIENLIVSILDNADKIIDTGINLMMALADGLIEALPEFLEKAPIIIEKLLKAFAENQPKLIKMGLKLIWELGKGLIKAIPTLIKNVPTIIESLVKEFGNWMKNIGDIGKDMVKGIWEGIKNAKDWFYDKLKGWVKDMLSFVKKKLGIKSPSRVMKEEVGQWLPKGIAVGIEANTDSVDDAIDDMNDEIISRMKRAVNVDAGYMGSAGTSGTVSQILTAYGTTTVVNDNKLYLDGDEIYENQQKVSAKKNLASQFGGATSVTT